MFVIFKRLLLTLIVIGGWSPGVAAQDFEAIKALAEQGDASAQNDLGFMYSYGEGVYQDTTEAVKWYRKSAEQGNAEGQYMLGLQYFNGDGVRKDYVRAYLWMSIAAARGDPIAVDRKPHMAKLMTSAQITEATWLSVKCYEVNFKGCE